MRKVIEAVLSRRHGGFGWLTIPNCCPKLERERICNNRATLLGFGAISGNTIEDLETLWSLTGGFGPTSEFVEPSANFNFAVKPN
jgi:hypothetical protein